MFLQWYFFSVISRHLFLVHYNYSRYTPRRPRLTLLSPPLPPIQPIHLTYLQSEIIFLPGFHADKQYAQPAFRGGKLSEESADKKQSNHVKRILDERKKDAKIDPILEQQFKAGRLLAMITSRPGQSGRADGYILEGKELDVSVDSASYYTSRILIVLATSKTNPDRR